MVVSPKKQIKIVDTKVVIDSITFCYLEYNERMAEDRKAGI